ncbi:capsule assembly Wzi family protein [Larkinella sp. VNQ87]|uniref:capsule assembly Wzi family protein n=1 Tax=Larkinella sp. VNQ87 TaxID=3400921 RepID=UPI003C05813C
MIKRLLFFFCPFLAQAQIEVKPVQLFTEVGGFYGTSTQTPFWLRSNQFGVVPTSLPYATLRAGVRRDVRYYSTADTLPAKRRNFFGVGYGLDVIGNVASGGQTALLVPEAYVNMRVGALELVGGRRREVVGLVDSTLSSGSYSWSGNALPMPKIQVGLSEYTSFPFKNGLLAFRGFLAHGWFDNRSIVRNAYLHQKALYARLGKPNWRIKLYAGFNHQVEWGGTTRDLTEGLVKNGRLPASAEAFYYMMIGKSLGAQTAGVDTTYYSRFDRENRIGNHLGTIDLGFEYSTKRISILLYRQSIFEDGSLFYGTNLEDGLNGIRFRNLNPASSGFRITGAVAEFLYTKGQGGSQFLDADLLRGRDNYFNHSQYRNGWSYQGNGIGTPFITPMTDSRPDLPRYGFFVNNRVRAYHAGLHGGFGRQATFLVKVSYSQNYGTYEMPFAQTVEQFSSLLQLGIPLNQSGLLATVSAAADQGGLFPNSNAIYAGIRKTWDYYKYRVGRAR